MRIFLSILILAFSVYAKTLFSNDKQMDSSQYINSLKDLVIATQKTRGLTNSYLNGNQVALMLVQDAKSDMKKAIDTMESLGLASDPVISQKAAEASKKLMELNRKAFKLDAKVAFERYTQEIANVLALAQMVGKRSSEHMSPFAKEASQVMMEQMLPLTENVGQLRGMGSGIAAKGETTTEQREKLLIMISETNKINDNLQRNMKDLVAKGGNHYSQDMSSKVSKMNDAIQSYTAFIKKEFYKDAVKVNPDNYFDAGTQIIVQIISIYNETNKAILDNSKGWI
ncbi:MAG: nitrate- and nitrite sensing domain-containing protein [Sulfurimonas sp.]|uniref:nitrate- and nitrite sensing domain-containing protein n=1 Tax=Sulfurimonas sp. TaxID=2022749 RepID=UPI0026285433|nr:nitrate- and nitrite sensing domain-containing protein [Sulfurimonas sp.]MDD5372999.1 nitrate- and nitrite sensing domain-containing protein [Sulfurimonas sp.]